MFNPLVVFNSLRFREEILILVLYLKDLTKVNNLDLIVGKSHINLNILVKTSCFETLVMGHWPFKTWQERQRCHLISSGNFTKHLKFYPPAKLQRLHQWLAVGDGSLAAWMFHFMSWIFLIQPEVLGLTWISWMQTSSKAPWRTTWRFPQGVRTFKLYLMSAAISLRQTRARSQQLCTTGFLLCTVTLILEMVV